MKKICFLISVACLLSLYYLWRSWPDQLVHIWFCDVGQGDGILISHQNYQVLIDGGPNDAISACLAQFMPSGDRTIEAVIATHADSDHITGLVNVLKTYRVETIFTEAYGRNTQVWGKFREAVRSAIANGSQIEEPKAGQKVQFDSLLSALIISPEQKRGSIVLFTSPLTEAQLSAIYDQQAKDFDSTNNEAIALFLTIGNVKIACVSDLELSRELALTQTNLLQDVDVIKAGHHGSKSSNLPEFLNILRPEVAVISVGKNNRFGHPHPEVIADFRARRIKTLRTDQIDTIEMITDGHKYWWHTHP